jgi:hypothetical protein
MSTTRTKHAPKGVPSGVNVDPPGKQFVKLVPKKKPPRLDVVTNGKPPQGEKFPPRDVPLGNGVLTHGKLKTSNLLLPPAWLGTTPKKLDIFHIKGELVPDNTGPLIGMVEVEVIPPPTLKLKLSPPLEEDPKVGIGIDRMGVETLCKLIDGYDDTTYVPQIEEPKENNMDGVVPMELRGGNVDITVILHRVFPPVLLEDNIIASTTLDKTIFLDIVGG